VIFSSQREQMHLSIQNLHKTAFSAGEKRVRRHRFWCKASRSPLAAAAAARCLPAASGAAELFCRCRPESECVRLKAAPYSSS